ncbi:uncharacterized protein LOC109857145 isoform X2 [Pseudomyrmex gracilis]|uniref:uncharacterized protein LOC109857145 isoform X2 n=1 Tax=Pseudomyrmex gracilis TaxID=219809 RepID=UPI000995BD5D|nr:uncharacterized protein LOC109857145 isoform X2 [Pseudomyrmex gracilis]
MRTTAASFSKFYLKTTALACCKEAKTVNTVSEQTVSTRRSFFFARLRFSENNWKMTLVIRLTQNCLASIPSMTLSQIIKVSKLSKYLQVKLYIVEHHVPNLKHIRNIQLLLSSVETQEIYLIHLLNIIANVCYIDKGVEKIAEEKELVEFVFCCFGVCNNKFQLQQKLFQVLHLIGCAIQANPASKWIHHLTNPSHFLGINMINLLANCPNKTKGVLESPLTEMIIAMDTLFELEMPDATSVLEHLFKINDLVTALLKWFAVAIVKSEGDRDDTRNISDNQWFIIDKWLTIMIAVTNLKSYRRTYGNNTDHIDLMIFIDTLNIIHRFYNNSLFYASRTNLSERNQPFLPTQHVVAAFDKSITLSLRLTRDKILPQNALVMHDILENFSKLVTHQPILNNSIAGLLINKKYLERYLLQHITHWSCKTIMEMFSLCCYIGDTLRQSIVLPRDILKKVSNVEVKCRYVFYVY